MEQFFTRVLIAVMTSDRVKAELKLLLDEAIAEGTKDIKNVLTAMADEIPSKIDDLEKNALGNLDAMDGKVGNLQEQLTGIPGQIINGILTPLQNLLKNPLGGLFGQQ